MPAARSATGAGDDARGGGRYLVGLERLNSGAGEAGLLPRHNPALEAVTVTGELLLLLLRPAAARGLAACPSNVPACTRKTACPRKTTVVDKGRG